MFSLRLLRGLQPLAAATLRIGGPTKEMACAGRLDGGCVVSSVPPAHCFVSHTTHAARHGKHLGHAGGLGVAGAAAGAAGVPAAAGETMAAAAVCSRMAACVRPKECDQVIGAIAIHGSLQLLHGL